MALLAGKPVLQHVIERCKLIKWKKQIILATPDTPESEPMLQLAEQLGVKHFCGSEDNVLERYYGAATFYELTKIVRITADCPLISPEICTEVIDLLELGEYDYVSNVYPKRNFPKGLDCEAFTFECLEAAFISKREDEHVTSWMQLTPGVNRALLAQKENRSHQNLCVDYPEDIKRLERIIKRKPELVVNNDKTIK
jgi:spore coat polysaccharide biosynthesis protein SpsF